MPELTILASLSRNWWILALRGVVALLFGFGAFFWPGLTLVSLLLLFGAFAMVDGITAVVEGAWARWWSLFVFGLLGIAAGLFTLFRPAITALALLMVIAGWAIARGILEIIAAIRLRKEISNEWLLALSGLFSIVFGLLLALFPGAGALSMIWLIGTYAFVVGVVFLILAFRLRGASHRLEPHPAV